MLKETTILKKHQVQGVNFMNKHNYVLNSDEMGLGKSLQAIAVQQEFDLDALIVCPYTLKYNWLNEYKKFTTEQDVRVGIKKSKINIVNYEELYLCTELFMKAGVVIFDEAHYLINMESQRTTYTHRMVLNHKPERLILLTGTPMKERVADFYSILRLLSYSPIKNNGRSILDKYGNQTRFSNRFSNRESFNVRVKTKQGGSFTKNIVKYSGVRNEKELRAYLIGKFICRKTKDVLDLPPLIFKDIQATYKLDKELEKEFEKFEKTGEFNVNSKVNSALACANFTADYVNDLLLGGQKPVIVFSDHIEPLRKISKKLRKGATKEFIIGEVDVEERQKIIDKFQNNEIDVLLLTYGAGSTGITITASNNMVLNDESWEYSTMEQAYKRFHRIGQDKACIVHRISGSKTSNKIRNIQVNKDKDNKKVFEGEW